jgi:hypothetical protein
LFVLSVEAKTVKKMVLREEQSARPHLVLLHLLFLRGLLAGAELSAPAAQGRRGRRA